MSAVETLERPQTVIESDIPGRLDRLPWSSFHWLLVTALGVTWILDGLEATVVGSIGPVLEEPATLNFASNQVGLAGTCYLAGCIAGALVFGYLADLLGRKMLFTVTLGVYMVGAGLTALSWNFWSFAVFIFITGMAIGGEYSAINSAIDELIPARVRGHVDLAINGTYWIGAAAISLGNMWLLDPNAVPRWLGWRIAFALGLLIGGAMILARRYVPESPRWLLTHGRLDEAEKIMAEIEERSFGPQGPADLPPVEQRVKFYPHRPVGFGLILHTIFVRYRIRALLGLVLIASQAFFYNGIFFSYPLVLKHFFWVAPEETPVYMLIFAVANFCGPLLLGRLFDTLGRKTMISATYALSGVLIIISEFFFLNNYLTANTQTLLWAVTFFFASAAASAGYLTVSEVFPLEMRALAIALFYVVGTAIGGLMAPYYFGALIETRRPFDLAIGYFVGAGLMLFAAVTELLIGVATEGKSLEDVTPPLHSEAA